MAKGTTATRDKRRKAGLRMISTARSRSTPAMSRMETLATSWKKSVTMVRRLAPGDAVGVVGPGAISGVALVPQLEQKRPPSGSFWPHEVQHMPGTIGRRIE